MDDGRTVSFSLGGMLFEYDENKNEINIQKHGISFRHAARVFFDYDRIEYYDDEHSENEDRYNTLGDVSVGYTAQNENGTVIGNINQFTKNTPDILFVVYTERFIVEKNGNKQEVTRLISARLATSFERGVYYGKYE